MIKIGMMLGERYEILEKIGTGGMSDVYKAKDHKLNRPVAVKVLKQEFSENANFVSKFRAEAQAAAGLMHPNIVNVYDVGDENGINYIVMELVEGITLKKYIEKKARLSVKEALTIAVQISMGIEAAHNNHIIHRDIKPQNVIISKEGKVKVTDFGIAKAATSNTITSNVMGSVHYTSPEQARGGYSDEKSDIYSLGITLFEMLTGRVPFNGDTTVAIAIKQIQEEMPSPREFISEIPLSVEQIVLKCTQKSPDRRYQSMAELIDDLKKSFTNPDDDFVKIVSDEEFGATRPVTAAEMETLKQTSRMKSAEPVEEITGTLPKAVNANENEEDEYDPKMDRITTILAIVVGVVICVVAILLIGKLVGIFKNGQTPDTSISDSIVSAQEAKQVIMPEVIDMTYLQAVDKLKKAGLVAKAKYEESSTVAEGVVISSSVHEGLKVEEGTEVVLTVSAGTNTVAVPNVVGMNLSAANKSIMDSDLKVDIVEEFSDEVEKGVVISQSPDAEAKAPLQSVVTIVISLGSETQVFNMPNVCGMPFEEAVLTITEAGLTVGSTDKVYNNLYEEGLVCYQSVSYGSEVIMGNTVDIQISKGPEPEILDKYIFSGNILAPTTLEDDTYASGTEVHIIIKTSLGEQLFDTKTTSFPVSVNMSNITGSDTGTVTLEYVVAGDPVEVTDPETGEVTLVPGESVEKTIIREIEFTKVESVD